MVCSKIETDWLMNFTNSKFQNQEQFRQHSCQHRSFHFSNLLFNLGLKICVGAQENPLDVAGSSLELDLF